MDSHVSILDGDFAAQLKKRTHKDMRGPLFPIIAGQCDPEEVINTHMDFLYAGANIIRTNTTNFDYEEAIACLRNPRKVNDLILCNVKLAKKAVNKYVTARKLQTDNDNTLPPRIAASCGSYFNKIRNSTKSKRLKENTFAKYDENFLYHWHLARVKMLMAAELDLFYFQSIPCIAEAQAVIRVMKEFPNVEIWISFKCLDRSLEDGSSYYNVSVECYNQLPHQKKYIGLDGLHVTDVLPKLINFSEMKRSLFPFVICPYYRKENDHPLAIIKTLPINEWMHYVEKIIIGGDSETTPHEISAIRSKVSELPNIITKDLVLSKIAPQSDQSLCILNPKILKNVFKSKL